MLTPALRRGARGWATWPWHVVLVAAFPVLFLFAENAAQQVTVRPLWVPLALSVAGAVVLLAICLAVRRDLPRAGLMATAALVLFFSFGHAWNLVDEFLGERWLLAAIWVASATGLIQLAWHGGTWVPTTTRILNVATAVLVAFNVARIGGYVLDTRVFPSVTGEVPDATVGPAGRPDVYYIILDRYAGEATLAEIYDYDNRPFLEALTDRGFAVAHDSWANYFKTAPSLVSSLSMEYLDTEVYERTGPETFAPIHAALRGRLAVPATFKGLGYEYVHIGNWWEPSAENADADVIERSSPVSQFSAVLLSTTFLGLFGPTSSTDEDPESIDYPELQARSILFGFEAIEQAAERPGPTFVFAHLTIPHSPYVFNPDGSRVTEAQQETRSDSERYIAQLEYANRRTLEVLDRIVDVPLGEPDPIVILQADEGPWPPGFIADQEGFQWLEASDTEIAWKYRILNAYRMPGVDLESLGFTDTISPVNAFRILFNAYFGTDLELLPDVTYLSPDYAHMYDLVPYRH